MRVLVFGGRRYSDWCLLCEVLDYLHRARDFSLVIHGGATGADALADTWAASRGIRSRRFAAYWASEGSAAGPLCNQRMLDEGRPDLAVGFPGGAGTADMTERLRSAGFDETLLPGRALLLQRPRLLV